jgi:hypothetical protein
MHGRYLLDTNAVIGVLEGDQDLAFGSVVERRDRNLFPGDVAPDV